MAKTRTNNKYAIKFCVQGYTKIYIFHEWQVTINSLFILLQSNPSHRTLSLLTKNHKSDGAQHP